MKVKENISEKIKAEDVNIMSLITSNKKLLHQNKIDLFSITYVNKKIIIFINYIKSFISSNSRERIIRFLLLEGFSSNQYETIFEKKINNKKIRISIFVSEVIINTSIGENIIFNNIPSLNKFTKKYINIL